MQKRTRTRNGCLTCRDRHLKCDETKPICGNCLKSNRVCYQGLRLNFSQYNLYTPERNIVQLPINGILDQSLTVASYYENGLDNYAPYRKYHTTKDLEESERQFEYDNNVILPPLKKSKSIAKLKKNDDDNDFDSLILENFDITKLLSNENFNTQYKKEFTLEFNPNNNDNRNNSISNSNSSEYEIETFNKDKLIIETFPHHLIINKRIKPITSLPESKLLISYTINSCWLMDLFNGKYIWKRIIPNYAISESIILNALLTCGATCYGDLNYQTINTYKRISIAKQNELLHKINSTNNGILANSSNSQIEKILLSINLIIISEYYSIINGLHNDLNIIFNQFKICCDFYENLQPGYVVNSLIIDNCIHSHFILDFLISMITTKKLFYNPFKYDFLYQGYTTTSKNDSWWVRKIIHILMKLVYIVQNNTHWEYFHAIQTELQEFEMGLPIVLNPIIFDLSEATTVPGLNTQELEYQAKFQRFPKIIFNSEKSLILHIIHHFIYIYIETNFPPTYSILNMVHKSSNFLFNYHDSNNDNGGGVLDKLNRRVCSMFLYAQNHNLDKFSWVFRESKRNLNVVDLGVLEEILVLFNVEL